MKYVSCDLIEHGLDFAQNAINFCCRTTKEGGGFKHLIDNYRGEKLNLQAFFDLKRKYRNKMKSGEGIPECVNCIYLEEKEYDDEDYISSINFNHGLNCNLKCVYCAFTHNEKSIYPEYDVYPVIKQLADEGYLRPGGQITVAGGEPTLYKNFTPLIKLFMEHNIRPVRILTNGIKYSEVISEALEKDFVNIMISVDAGSHDMYKWIKGVDCYDKVWQNISKYIKVAQNEHLVKTKYIIMPEINDDKNEIIKYLDKSKDTGISTVSFDIELNWYGENGKAIPQELKDLVEFTIEETTNRGMNYEPVDRVVSVIQEIKKDKEIHVKFRGHEI